VTEAVTAAAAAAAAEAIACYARLMGDHDLAPSADEPSIPPTVVEGSTSDHPAKSKLAQRLFWLALALYILTRVIGLADYPVYFFCDEAIQTNLAANFLRNDCRNAQGELFPTYFKNYSQHNLGASVYAQVIPTLVFDRSVFLTRLTAMLFTLLAFYWVSLTLRDVFKIDHWWTGGMLLSIAPVWFLHSRTAFETTLMVSFYSGFIYEYLQYRDGKTRRLPLALLWGALAFYSYSPGRVIVVVTGLVFLFMDLRHHWRNRRTVMVGAGLLMVLVLPFIRFVLAHPTANQYQLRLLGSYWLHPIPITEKLSIFATEYLEGLNPLYWFRPNTIDLVRHVMGPHPHIFTLLLPFFAIGVVVALVSFRRPANRSVLLILLIAPIAAALVEIAVTRALVYLIPATLLIALGLDIVMRAVSARTTCRPGHIAIAVFVLFGSTNVLLMASALRNGPTWSDNYSMGGLQWGARQLFSAVREFTELSPGQKLEVSPTWANGTDSVARFFFPEGMPFQMGIPDLLMYQIRPKIEEWVFVVTPEEHQTLSESGKFAAIEILETIAYPNGKPGFYFLHLAYKEDSFEILDEEARERRRLRESSVVALGSTIRVGHSELDMGEIAHLFDGDRSTVARTREANPMVLEMQLEGPMAATGLRLVTRTAMVAIDIELFPPGSDEPIVRRAMLQGEINHPEVHVDFLGRHEFDRFRLVLTDTTQQEPGHVHLWEMAFED